MYEVLLVSFFVSFYLSFSLSFGLLLLLLVFSNEDFGENSTLKFKRWW